MIVQEMPGAAHLLATNHVFNVAKPDGLTILASNPKVAVAQLSKIEHVRFDVRKFHWIGSTGADGVALSVRVDLPYKSFEDIRKADRTWWLEPRVRGRTPMTFHFSSRNSPDPS